MPLRPSLAPSGSHTVLAAYARLIRDLVAHWGVEPDVVLARAGLSAKEIEDPFARVDLIRMLALIEAARELTGEPGLGWYAGLQSKISTYGFLGFGIMSAATLRAALELLVQFAPVLSSILTMRLENHGESHVALVIDETADLGASRDFVLAGIIVAVWQIGYRVSNLVPTWHAEVGFPEPRYYPRLVREGLRPDMPGMSTLAALSGIGPPIRFRRPRNRLIFERERLGAPLVMADDAANRIATQQCEVALRSLATDLVARVRRSVERNVFLSMEGVAVELHMSPRTLRRQLADRGLTFSTLATEARRDRARHLLLTTTHSLGDIAERVGYSSITTFGRAFQAWTGMSPGAFRRSSRK